jgi:SAM-dependent methyltransferase
MEAQLPAAAEWTAELKAWAIPPDILAAAPESPWGCPTSLFSHDAHAPTTPTHARVREALPVNGSVLDVGAGGGRASLPSADRAAQIVAVDESESMLQAFAAAASKARTIHREVLGRWPDVATAVEPADVVVCANVVYNVWDIVPFIEALADHAMHRVVIEMTARHPLTSTASLWDHFHPEAPRPGGPNVDHMIAVLAERNIQPHVEHFHHEGRFSVSRAELVAFVRRRLCLPADHDPEIDTLLGDPPQVGIRDLATLWWDV